MNPALLKYLPALLSLPLIGSQAHATELRVGGPNPDHAEIAEAVAAATDGDTILVWPGVYAGFRVIDKEVAILGPATVTGPVSVRDLSAGKLVLLCDLVVESAPAFPSPALSLSACLGEVRLMDSEFTALTPGAGADVTACADVNFHGCALTGSAGAGADGLRSVSASVSAYDSVLTGGQGALPFGSGNAGAHFQDSHGWVVGCTVYGGDARPDPAQTCSQPGLRGGDGIRAETNSTVVTFGNTYTAGFGAGLACNPGFNGVGVNILFGSTEIFWTNPYDTHCHSDVVLSGCPCNNAPPTGGVGGCVNSTGQGGVLEASGVPSVTLDSLILTASRIPPRDFGIFVQNVSTFTGAPLHDGVLCLAQDSALVRHYDPPHIKASLSNAAGVAESRHDFTSGDLLGIFAPGMLVNYQYWYRDRSGPCGNGGNITSAVSVIWMP